MSLAAILGLGFFLGMRHATDVDHVVAVSTIVTRERSLRAAAALGVSWGVGHGITILLVGGAIILFGVVVPPTVGLGMELSVAIMLLLLGGVNVRSVLQDARALAHAHKEPAAAQPQGHAHPHLPVRGPRRGPALRPLCIGIVHGLAGSAAVALLVLGTIREPLLALGYLCVFGLGTIAGMLLITTALAAPVAAAATHFGRLQRTLATLTGIASMAFGVLLVYQIGFVQGLFTGGVR